MHAFMFNMEATDKEKEGEFIHILPMQLCQKRKCMHACMDTRRRRVGACGARRGYGTAMHAFMFSDINMEATV
jgi:hypothetical protein